MKRIGQTTATLSAGVLALVLVSLAAAAPGSKPITVTGKQTIIDEPKGMFLMHGSLVGAWNVTGFKLHYAGSDGTLVASGSEMFKGCHDTDRNGLCDAGEPAGTLRFTSCTGRSTSRARRPSFAASASSLWWVGRVTSRRRRA
jgi:hypothetical protein